MKKIYIYKNQYNNTYFTDVEWHDGAPNLSDTTKLEKAKMFDDKEYIFSDAYIRISYEEEYKKTLKLRRKEKIKKIDETERDI
jgi:hypothetical protein